MPFYLLLWCQNSSPPFVFHHSMELSCNNYYYMGKLLEAMFTYEGVIFFGCAWFFFSLFVDFLWSEQVVNGLFVVCLDLEM